MRLGRRLSAGTAHHPPAPEAPAEPSALAVTPEIDGPDQRAVEIVAAAARREFGELAAGR